MIIWLWVEVLRMLREKKVDGFGMKKGGIRQLDLGRRS